MNLIHHPISSIEASAMKAIEAFNRDMGNMECTYCTLKFMKFCLGRLGTSELDIKMGQIP